MAKIASKIIWWANVSDADEFAIRVIADGVDFGYDHVPNIVVDNTNNLALEEIEADLGGLSLEEGIYDIYITAVDIAGNESDPFMLADAVLDFTPPSAPSVGGFR